MKKNGILFTLLPLILTFYFWLAPENNRDLIQAAPTIGLIQFLGLSGVTLLALNFVLATRLKFLERIFGGLDKLYYYHKQTGKLAWIMIIAHVTAVMVDAYPSIELIKSYIFPTTTWGYTFGVIAFDLLNLILILTLFVKLPYHIWKFIHKFNLFVILFVTLHYWQVGSSVDYTKYWLLALSAISTICFIYKQFLYGFIGPVYHGAVSAVTAKYNVTEIVLKLTHPFKSYLPAQFAFFQFLDTADLPKRQHPFTISKLKGNEVRISAKKSGDFTNKMENVSVGDHVKVIGPYGFFGERYLMSSRPQIWIAGGIGITPFLSMLDNERDNPLAERKLNLIWSVSKLDEAIYNEEIKYKAGYLKHFNYWLYESEGQERINATKIATIMEISDLPNYDIFICGPVPMIKALRQQFLAKRVPKSQIISEEFSLK